MHTKFSCQKMTINNNRRLKILYLNFLTRESSIKENIKIIAPLEGEITEICIHDTILNT